jgi:hypothetical protein
MPNFNVGSSQLHKLVAGGLHFDSAICVLHLGGAMHVLCHCLMTVRSI